MPKFEKWFDDCENKIEDMDNAEKAIWELVNGFPTEFVEFINVDKNHFDYMSKKYFEYVEHKKHVDPIKIVLKAFKHVTILNCQCEIEEIDELKRFLLLHLNSVQKTKQEDLEFAFKNNTLMSKKAQKEFDKFQIKYKVYKTKIHDVLDGWITEADTIIKNPYSFDDEKESALPVLTVREEKLSKLKNMYQNPFRHSPRKIEDKDDMIYQDYYDSDDNELLN